MAKSKKKKKTTKKATKKKFGVWVVWGVGATDAFEDKGEINLHPEDGSVNYYSFNTQEELNAFKEGIAEASGWMESSVVDEAEVEETKTMLKRK